MLLCSPQADTLKGAQTPRTSAVRNCRGKQFRTLKSHARRNFAPCASLIGAASSFRSDRRGVPFRRADAPPSLPSRAFPLHPSATVACGLPCSVLVAAASRRFRL